MTKARQNADNYAADITGVTAGTDLTGGGTSGTVTVSAAQGLIDRTIRVFEDATARDAAITSPTTGMVVYLETE
jgi:hypothetical protein